MQLPVRLLATLLPLALLTACASSPPARPGPVATAPVAGLNQSDFVQPQPDAYILRPADRLQVTVFREPDLSRDAQAVSADGQIALPLLGQIDVAGLTVREVERVIENALGARYLVNPDVSVNVLEYASHKVTVEGAVVEPGVYDFQPGTRLSSAIAMAKGTTRVAKIREIAVFRQARGGMEVAKFDLAAMRDGTMADPVIEPLDRIVVGTDGLSLFWQDVLRAVPAIGLFTQI